MDYYKPLYSLTLVNTNTTHLIRSPPKYFPHPLKTFSLMYKILFSVCILLVITACSKNHDTHNNETSCQFTVNGKQYLVKGQLQDPKKSGSAIKKASNNSGFLLTVFRHDTLNNWHPDFITLFVPLTSNQDGLVKGAVFSNTTVHHSVIRDWMGISVIGGLGFFDDYDGTTDRFTLTLQEIKNNMATGTFNATITDTGSKQSLIIKDGRFYNVPIQN